MPSCGQEHAEDDEGCGDSDELEQLPTEDKTSSRKLEISNIAKYGGWILNSQPILHMLAIFNREFFSLISTVLVSEI